MVFLLCFLPSAPVPPLLSHQPAISGTLRSSRRRPETRHLSSIKRLKGPRAGLGGGRKAGGHAVVPEGIHSPEVPRPDRQFPWRKGPRVWGWKGIEEQGRREDKPAVICLFNWLKCSKESCVVILALGLDRVQAPGFGRLQEALVCPSPGG